MNKKAKVAKPAALAQSVNAMTNVEALRVYRLEKSRITDARLRYDNARNRYMAALGRSF